MGTTRIAVGRPLPWERREIGGASGHSHSGAGFGISFEELTKAYTPNLSTLPLIRRKSSA
jgi:hypothetical protein